MDVHIQSVHQHNYFVSFNGFINLFDFSLIDIASGGSEDWTRGTLGIVYSYCLELPGTSFIVPTSEIKKTGHFEFLINNLLLIFI